MWFLHVYAGDTRPCKWWKWISNYNWLQMTRRRWQLKSSVQNFSVSSCVLFLWSYVVIGIHNLMHLSFNFKWALSLVHSNFEFYPNLTVSLHNQTWIPLIQISPMLLTNYRTSTFALGKSEVHKQKLKKNQWNFQILTPKLNIQTHSSHR